MTAPVPADAWVPVEMRWRHVRLRDVILDPEGRPWMVSDVRVVPRLYVQIHQGGSEFWRDCDPDATVRVLVPYIEAAGVVALREQLGPVRVLGRNGGA